MVDLNWPKSDSNQTFRFNQLFFQKKAHKNYQNTIKQFKHIINSFAFFNLSFFALVLIEIVSFLILLIYLSKSSIIAFYIGGIFLTCFTYFALLFYFQTKKSEQIVQLKERFIISCKRSVQIPLGTAEHHLTIARAAIRLSEHLNDFEYKSLPQKFYLLPFFKKKVGSFLHKEDVFKFKEQLILAAIQEHIKQISSTPTDLEVHASIANAYCTLSKLYLEGKNEIFRSKSVINLIEQKFEAAVKSTIEEFKILNDYAPNDPWVHAQLAKSYNILNMKEKEAYEYEYILKLCPNDNKVLFQLGILYFDLSKPSKALKVYEKLKSKSYKKASDLLSYYGVSKTQELFEESI